MTQIWQATLQDLRNKVSVHNYDSWFRNITCHHLEDDVAYLEVADDFIKAWIEDNYLDLIEDSLESVTGTIFTVLLQVEGTYDQDTEPSEVTVDLPDQDLAAKDGRHREAIQESIFQVQEPDLRSRVLECGMNPRYTFEEFVVGGSNQFVHAACNAVVTKPGRTYNPLFIFGGVGLGKTHLLQAVGIEILRREPTKRVRYLSSEEFMNQLITSLRQRDMNAFRMQFRNNCDVLLIDDIQFIAGKDATQEEFFHTFNALHQSGKQIIITSDKSPKELPGVEERLSSRFSWGLIADIQPPSVETRIAILEKKAEADGLKLPKDVALLIAGCVRSNVRELEGTLIRLSAQASLLGMPMTMHFVREMLKRMNLEEHRSVSVDGIIKSVAHHYGIRPNDIKGPRRTRNISIPRQVAMFLARRLTDHSYPELGRNFGGKDHTTVLAACRRMDKELAAESDIAHAILELEKLFL